MFSFFKRKRGSADNAKPDDQQTPVAPKEQPVDAAQSGQPPAEASGAEQASPVHQPEVERPSAGVAPPTVQPISSQPFDTTTGSSQAKQFVEPATQEPVALGGAPQAAEVAKPPEAPAVDLTASPEAPVASPDPKEVDVAAPKAGGAVLPVAPVSGAMPAPQAEPLSAAPQSAPVVEAAPEPAPAKKSWFSRLSKGLARTGQSISSLFVGVPVDENLFEELETALIMADAGVEATETLLTELRARVRKERLSDGQQVKLALRDSLSKHLQPLEKPFPLDRAKPLIVMIAGVNGAGKTTSIGKLAYAFQQQGRSVLLAAGDTFRAAAREQLIEWGERNNVSVIAQEGGDPAAVAFDAVNAGRARQSDVVMIDTAGRLPTQLHLMEELKKIRRVIGKADGDAPHEVLLVVDGNTGQNVISQIKAFDAAINLTGLIVTKLDGTAKGGALAAVAAGSQGVRAVPVYWIGVGEGMEDLQPFVAAEFAAAIIAD